MSVAPRRSPWHALLLLAACLQARPPHAQAQDAAPPEVAAPSPAASFWVGTWVVHEPDHGSYQGTEYRFLPSGELELVASVDTNASGAEHHRLLGAVASGHRRCHFGRRWATDARPNRVRIEGLCNDGTTRTILLELDARVLTAASVGAAPHVVSVGGRRGYRFVSSFPVEMLRYSSDVTQRYFTDAVRRGVRTYGAGDDAWSREPALP